MSDNLLAEDELNREMSNIKVHVMKRIEVSLEYFVRSLVLVVAVTIVGGVINRGKKSALLTTSVSFLEGRSPRSHLVVYYLP